MTNLFLAALVSVLLVEIALRLPLGDVVADVLKTVGRSMKVVGAPRISDHWKEKAMGAYARATFVGTGRLALLLGLLIGIAVAAVLGFDRVRPGFLDFMLGWGGIAATLLFATLWYMVRRRGDRARPASAYSAGDQLLHRLALDSPAVAGLAFRLDQRLAGPPGASAARADHVFVSGLARSGTTVLMRRFHASGDFRSLTYRDMPFVLAPNLWQRISALSRKRGEATERAHGDRLLVDFDSPESLDEVFWRVFDGAAYIRSTNLVPHAPDAGLVERYRRYVHAILASAPGQRYLAKNNNNILRLAAIRAAFPDALILVPFRDPLDHADSLLRMHRTFVAQQAADPFVRDYMGWLGHHEFGSDHRPFRFGDAPGPAGDPQSIDYWLDRWIEAYRHVESNLPAGAVLVCYEDLCTDPGVWCRLADAAGVPRESPAYAPLARNESRASGGDPERLAQAQALYQRLRQRAAADVVVPA